MGELGDALERLIEHYLQRAERVRIDADREPAPDFRARAEDDDLLDQIQHLRAVVKERDQQLRDYANEIRDLRSRIQLQRRRLRVYHEREAERIQREGGQPEISAEPEPTDTGEDEELTFSELWALHEIRHGAVDAEQEKIKKRLELLELSGIAQGEKIEQIEREDQALLRTWEQSLGFEIQRNDALNKSHNDFALEIRSVITRLNKRIDRLEEGSPQNTKGSPSSV